MPPLFLAALLVTSEFQQYFRRPQKHLDIEYFFIGIAGVLCFCLGSFIGARIRTGSVTVTSLRGSWGSILERQLRVASVAVMALAIAAYLILLGPVAIHPAILTNTLAGGDAQVYMNRLLLNRIPGVTSFVHLGILYVVLLSIRVLYFPAKRPLMWERCAFSLLLGLVFMRTLLWSERLAIIEFILPAVILWCRKPDRSRVLLALAPVAAVLTLVVVFGGFEYFRSWMNTYRESETGFVAFVLMRIFGYYITALDNGAGLLNYTGGGGIGPVYTLECLWKFPVDFGQRWLFSAIGYNDSVYLDFLDNYANAEFNSMSGIFTPFIDYGALGTVLLFAFGVLMGFLYRSYIEGTLSGLIVYPSVYVSLLEMPRIFYFTSVRYFVVLGASIAVVLWVSLTLQHHLQYLHITKHVGGRRL